MERESLRVGMFIAGVLLAAVPVTIGAAMAFLVVRRMWEERVVGVSEATESEGGKRD